MLNWSLFDRSAGLLSFCFLDECIFSVLLNWMTSVSSVRAIFYHQVEYDLQRERIKLSSMECWQMFPIAVTCGNTFVLKPSEKDPGDCVYGFSLCVCVCCCCVTIPLFKAVRERSGVCDYACGISLCLYLATFS